MTDRGELESYSEALEYEMKQEWLQAMQEEIESLQENYTYYLVNYLRVIEHWRTNGSRGWNHKETAYNKIPKQD